MTYTYLTQLFTGGLNKDADPAAIDLIAGQNATVTQLADAQNMLFERALAITRPGVSTVSTPSLHISSSHTVIKTEGLTTAPLTFLSPLNQRGGYVIAYDGVAFHLWTLNCQVGTGQIFDAVEITGPGGYSPSLTNSWSVDEVNGVLLFGTFNGGMMRWDPTVGTYTIMNAASNFAYVTGHYSRAVGAFGGPSTALYHQTVGWSAAGDETNWTSLDSGVSTLADIPDAITGVGVINGVVLLARTYGFHLGWATGTFPIIYNWRMHSQKSVGCFYPETFKIYKNVAYFVSDSGIHTFDGSDIVDIGEGIYTEMMSHIQTDLSGAIKPIGFISPSYNSDMRPAYHVVLVRQAVAFPRANLPHYVYDIREQKWSRHTYTTINFCNALRFPAVSSSTTSVVNYVALVQQISGASPSFVAWVPGAAQDQMASITTGQINLSGDPTMDNQLDRVLVVYWSFGTSFTITINVNYILNGVPATTTTTFNTYTSGGVWDKRWVDIRVVGDFHQVTLNFPAGTSTPVKVKKLVFEFTQVGKVRT